MRTSQAYSCPDICRWHNISLVFWTHTGEDKMGCGMNKTYSRLSSCILFRREKRHRVFPFSILDGLANQCLTLALCYVPQLLFHRLVIFFSPAQLSQWTVTPGGWRLSRFIPVFSGSSPRLAWTRYHWVNNDCWRVERSMTEDTDDREDKGKVFRNWSSRSLLLSIGSEAEELGKASLWRKVRRRFSSEPR